jgi:hypothetical protein
MKLLFVILFSVAIMTLPASAQAVPAKTFHFGITPDQAVAAAPHLEWSRNDDPESGPLEGAFAYDAAEFGGHTWDVTVGDKYGLARKKGEVMFQREFTYEHEDDCAKAMSETLGVLEPVYGAFGTDDDFFNPNSTRYFNKEYQRVQAGARSFMREYPESSRLKAWETFGRPAGKQYQVWIHTNRIDPDKICYLEMTFKRLETK